MPVLRRTFPPAFIMTLVFLLPSVIQENIAYLIVSFGLPSINDFVYKDSKEFKMYQQDTKARLRREHQLPRAVASTLRSFPFGEIGPVATTLGQSHEFPITIFWGTLHI